MKRVLFIALMLLESTFTLFAQQVTFRVNTPGTLSSMIAESKKYTITNMKIVGTINSDDMLFIREMAGRLDSEWRDVYFYPYRIYYGKETEGRLEILDLSEASFVDGGNGYISYTKHLSGNTYADGRFTLVNGVINYAQFAWCSRLKKVILPDNITEIRDGAFYSCPSLEEVTMPSYTTVMGEKLFFYTSVRELSLGKYAKGKYPLWRVFSGAKDLKVINLNSDNPNYKEIGGVIYSADKDSLLFCPAGLEGVVNVAEGTKVIISHSFASCSSLSSILFPSSVEKVENYAFLTYEYYNSQYPQQCQPASIYCYGEIPPLCDEDSFYGMVQNTAQTILYVPRGFKANYEYAVGWADFTFIEEFSASPCPKPSISYSNGELQFHCDVAGAEYETVITDVDVKTHYGSSIHLTGTYNISVYATAPGFDRSDPTTATLCWLDGEFADEDGIHNVAEYTTKLLLLQTGNGKLTVTSDANGAYVSVYTVDGKTVGEAKIVEGKATVAANLSTGDIAIVKIGDKAIKVVWQE